MKIEKENPKFQPVVITLESQAEVDAMHAIMNVSNEYVAKDRAGKSCTASEGDIGALSWDIYRATLPNESNPPE